MSEVVTFFYSAAFWAILIFLFVLFVWAVKGGYPPIR